MNRLIAALAIALALPSTAFAGDKETALIAKVIDAYGSAITELSSFTVNDEFINVSFGQDHSPSLTELNRSKQILTMDLKNNKAVYDTWFEGRGGNNQNSTITDSESAYNINYQAGTYGAANNADPYSFAGGSMRTSDALLVYHLSKASENVTQGDDKIFMNRPHHVLTMPFPLSPDLSLYIDAETYLITKMVRENPQFGNLDYIFSEYKKDNGITYAAKINFYIDGQPSAISLRHELSFNAALDESLFTLPTGLTSEGERIDTTDMRALKIADGVYHVGQGNAFSLFIDTNLGMIAAGAYGGLAQRLAFLQAQTDNYKPLTHSIITHHHADHLGGVADALELGAQLVTVADNVQAIKDSISSEPGDSAFSKVGPRATYGSGNRRVEIYEVSTIHAASFLVTYIPSAKTVFIADHFGTPFADATVNIGQAGLDMLAALESLEINISKIATAHNARIFSLADMRKSAAAYQPTVCSGQRPVCENSQ